MKHNEGGDSFKEKTQWDIIKVMIVQEKNTMKYNEGVITLQNMYIVYENKVSKTSFTQELKLETMNINCAIAKICRIFQVISFFNPSSCTNINTLPICGAEDCKIPNKKVKVGLAFPFLLGIL